VRARTFSALRARERGLVSEGAAGAIAAAAAAAAAARARGHLSLAVGLARMRVEDDLHEPL
jgi:hypothetical protein